MNINSNGISVANKNITFGNGNQFIRLTANGITSSSGQSISFSNDGVVINSVVSSTNQGLNLSNVKLIPTNFSISRTKGTTYTLSFTGIQGCTNIVSVISSSRVLYIPTFVSQNTFSVSLPNANDSYTMVVACVDQSFNFAGFNSYNFTTSFIQRLTQNPFTVGTISANTKYCI